MPSIRVWTRSCDSPYEYDGQYKIYQLAKTMMQ